MQSAGADLGFSQGGGGGGGGGGLKLLFLFTQRRHCTSLTS